MATKDTDDMATYAGPHRVQQAPKHRATPNGKNHTKRAPVGAHAKRDAQGFPQETQQWAQR